MRRRPLSILLLSSLVAAVFGTAAVRPTAAVEDPDQRRFGIVGLVSGQVARLNVVSVPARDDVPPGPCRVTLSFVDSLGNVLLRDGHPVLIDDPNLRPGEATFVDFHFVSTDPIQRMPIRAVVTVNPGPCRRALVASVEIFDFATGRTLIYLVEDPNQRR